MLTSPLKVSAVMRADPCPNVKGYRLVATPSAENPGRTVIGNSLSTFPLQVVMPTCALANFGSARRIAPSCVTNSYRPSGMISLSNWIVPLVVSRRTIFDQDFRTMTSPDTDDASTLPLTSLTEQSPLFDERVTA